MHIMQVLKKENPEKSETLKKGFSELFKEELETLKKYLSVNT